MQLPVHEALVMQIVWLRNNSDNAFFTFIYAQLPAK